MEPTDSDDLLASFDPHDPATLLPILANRAQDVSTDANADSHRPARAETRIRVLPPPLAFRRSRLVIFNRDRTPYT